MCSKFAFFFVQVLVIRKGARNEISHVEHIKPAPPSFYRTPFARKMQLFRVDPIVVGILVLIWLERQDSRFPQVSKLLERRFWKASIHQSEELDYRISWSFILVLQVLTLWRFIIDFS